MSSFITVFSKVVCFRIIRKRLYVGKVNTQQRLQWSMNYETIIDDLRNAIQYGNITKHYENQDINDF